MADYIAMPTMGSDPSTFTALSAARKDESVAAGDLFFLVLQDHTINLAVAKALHISIRVDSNLN